MTRKIILLCAAAMQFALLAAGDLKLVPGFKTCSIELGNAKSATVKYRKTGGKWMKSVDLVDVEKANVVRGSLLDLEENTNYELEVAAGNKKYQRNFTTRKFDVPVARTICLTKKNCGKTFKPVSGTPDGYIRYTAEPGFVFTPGKRSGIGILIDKAQYIILDGLTITGGVFNAVRIRDSKHIRVVNCDISGFGQGGVFRPDLDGKYYNAKNNAIWHDAGIAVRGCEDVIIERNYIHDPVTPGNSWFYSHPAGSDGLFVGNTKQAVIRYNDIVGSDKFRWNDAIAGDCNNFTEIGGPAEDAEIYGNYFAFGNDDSVELDGGQKNCRFFFNRIEGFFCGVSVAAIRRGPSYVYCNEITRPGDEFGLHGVALKTLCGKSVKWGRGFFYRNRAEGNPMGYPRMAGSYTTPRFTCRENVYPAAGKESMYAVFTEKNYTVDTNDSLPAPDGVPAYPETLPVRTGVLKQDKTVLFFDQTKNMASQTVTITYNGKTAADFSVKVCKATEHFKVVPSSGVVKPGESITLTVTPKKSSKAKLNCGALLFRLADGISLPVSVYVDARRDAALTEKVFKSLIKGDITADGSTFTITFDVPESGNYVLFIRKSNDCATRVDLVVNDGKPVLKRLKLRSKHHDWDVPAGEKDCNPPLVLEKGKCKIVLQKSPRSSKTPNITQAYLCRNWHDLLPILDQLN